MAYLSAEDMTDREAWEAIRRAHGRHGPERPARALGFKVASPRAGAYDRQMPPADARSPASGIGAIMGRNYTTTPAALAAIEGLRLDGVTRSQTSAALCIFNHLAAALPMNGVIVDTTAAEVARSTGYATADVSKALASLERLGLIARRPGEKSRGRGNTLLIAVNPAFAFRGQDKAIASAVGDYAAFVALGNSAT